MRALKFFLPGLAAVALAGCAGYHLGPVNGAVAGEKSIEVLPFNNQTLQPRLGDAVTQSLRERLQTDATYHLATHGSGDVVVTGVIRNTPAGAWLFEHRRGDAGKLPRGRHRPCHGARPAFPAR